MSEETTYGIFPTFKVPRNRKLVSTHFYDIIKVEAKIQEFLGP